MDDRLLMGKPPPYVPAIPRPTQPPILRGRGNEYRQKRGDALWLGLKIGTVSYYVEGLYFTFYKRGSVRYEAYLH